MNYEHSDTLIEIFFDIQQNKDLKEEFIKTLEKEIKQSNDFVIWEVNKGHFYISISSLCFYTLIKLGLIENAINSLKNRTQTAGVISGNIFILFCYIFNEEENYFNNSKEINELIKILKSLSC